MKPATWPEIAEGLRILALTLRASPPAVSLKPFVADDSIEARADAWIRTVLLPGGFELPSDPALRRLLAVRAWFAYGVANTSALTAARVPAATANRVNEIMLVQLWHERLRSLWLSGSGAIVRPSDN